MNIHDKSASLPRVTKGALPKSAKIYLSPEGAEDIKVPFREITMTEGSGEPPFRVYDTSGAYTDEEAEVDVDRGLDPIRDVWRSNRVSAGQSDFDFVENYDGRAMRPEDNGNVSASHLARARCFDLLWLFGVKSRAHDQLSHQGYASACLIC